MLGDVGVLEPCSFIYGFALRNGRQNATEMICKRELRKPQTNLDPFSSKTTARNGRATAERTQSKEEHDAAGKKFSHPKVLNTALLMTPDSSTSI